jgi:hypothetical protein
MKFIKKYESFVTDEPVKVKSKTKHAPLPMATAEDVAYRFTELIEKSGDDIKKYVEIR